MPTKFGIAFDRGHLNQGGALLHVYADGQVLLTHGGTEMGQGLHTKMVQVCARALAIPPSKIHISEMATNTVPNASTTAASVSTDLYGKAVQVKDNIAFLKYINNYNDETNVHLYRMLVRRSGLDYHHMWMPTQRPHGRSG